jgi:carbamoyltransferase
VVGWYQGGAEFGPRALGNRSILADPRSAGVRDFINGKVKFREDFRPFAPSVLAEDTSDYFDCDTASPHMLLVAPVRPEWRDKIPGVVHQDNSARIQTVTEDANPLYYKLLTAFKKQTGIGLVLNTSLNRRGQPIAETPDDALALFLYSDMHVLVIGDYVVTKLPGFDARLNALKNIIAQNKAKELVGQMIAAGN